MRLPVQPSGVTGDDGVSRRPPPGRAGPSGAPQEVVRWVLAHLATARAVDAGNHLELFLVAAVAAVLGIRGYLRATGYPKMGGGGLHIAHMLWGGFLMLVALVLLLAFLGGGRRRLAAVVGGLGFGTFIDELGKFITSDNDYFYRPTVGLMYIIFVLLFLAFRAIERRRPLSPEEYLANAAASLPDLVLGGATPSERARTLVLLEQSRSAGPLADAVRAFVAASVPAADAPPTLPERLAARGRRLYERLVAWPWFGHAVVVVFVGTALLGGAGLLLLLLVGIAVLISTVGGFGPTIVATLPAEIWSLDWPVELAAGVASLAVVVCSIVGAWRLRRDRLLGLRWLERGVLLSLLLEQPIRFFADQFGALSNLGFDLILLVGVRYLIAQEITRRAGQRAGQRAGPAGDQEREVAVRPGVTEPR